MYEVLLYVTISSLLVERCAQQLNKYFCPTLLESGGPAPFDVIVPQLAYVFNL